MRSHWRLGAVVVAVSGLVGPGALAASKRTDVCGLSRAQATRYVHRTEHRGARALAALAAQSEACYEKRARTADAGPSGLTDALLAATKTSPALTRSMAQYATSRASSGTGPLPPESGSVVADGGSDDNMSTTKPMPLPTRATAAQVRAHAASTCWTANLISTNRIYVQSRHVMSISKTLQAWCWDGFGILSITGWGHAVWVDSGTAFCAAGLKVDHGAEGAWEYSSGGWHPVWEHGAVWDYLGSTGFVCQALQGPYNAALRVAGNGYWDGYYDYPYSYPS